MIQLHPHHDWAAHELRGQDAASSFRASRVRKAMLITWVRLGYAQLLHSQLRGGA